MWLAALVVLAMGSLPAAQSQTCGSDSCCGFTLTPEQRHYYPWVFPQQGSTSYCPTLLRLSDEAAGFRAAGKVGQGCVDNHTFVSTDAIKLCRD